MAIMKKKEKTEIEDSCLGDACENIIAEPEITAEAPKSAKGEKKKPTASEMIYNILDTAEKVATILAKKQKTKKKKAKKQLKKDKKIGKIDKKTGAVKLKKIKKDKVQKPMKRYKPPKK